MKFEVIAFDADDTLWHSEDGFHANEQLFVKLLSPFAASGVDAKAALTAVERKNLGVFGYGVKSFGLSAVEAAITISEGRVTTEVIAALIEGVRAQLSEAVRLLPDVAEVIARVGQHHRMVLITKGDLIHQWHKVEASGLAHHFSAIEVVLEKDADTYDRIFTKLGVAAAGVCMIGNSVRNDVLPVLSLGGTAVHIPYPLLWELEHIEPIQPEQHDGRFAELTSISELPEWLGLPR